VVAATLVGLWLGFGVSVGEIARFAAYEGLLVGLPGILAYRVLTANPGGALRQIAIGWPLGYGIEVGSFMLTAALGVRWLFPVLPLAAAGAAALILIRGRRRGDGRDDSEGAGTVPFPPAAVWVVAGVAVAALAYLAFGYFVVTPLPGDVASVQYPPDSLLDIGYVAEAKNHWPMENPSVVGVSLPYHIYSFVHMAGVSQVTGIEPSTILFRLFPGTLIVLVTLQVVALGRELGRRVWIGPVAAILVLLVGELDLDPDRLSPLATTFFDNMPLSPTFLFGIPPFLAITTLLVTALGRRRALRIGEAVLLLLLLLTSAGAKASTLPVLIGGLVLWVIWAKLWPRAPLRNALIAIGLAIIAFGVSYALVYKGGGDGSFSLGLFGFMDFTVFDELIPPDTRSTLGDAAVTGAGGPLALLGVVLPALGIVWVIRERGLRPKPGEAFLLALFLTSVAAFALFSHEALGQAYFLHYGYIAGCVLSAEGILIFVERIASSRDRALPALGWLVAGALVGGGIAAAIIYVPDPDTASLGRLALGYGAAAAAVVALALVASRLPGFRTARVGAGIALLLTMSLGLLNTPLDEGTPLAQRLDHGETPYIQDSPTTRGLTRELYEGLRWVRDHSGKDEVIAVNNHFLDAEGHDSRYWYYTAFTERRALLEAWIGTIDTIKIGFVRVASGEEVPYPVRRRLNAEVFDRADPAAIETLRTRYGVRLLLVDKVHGSASPRLGEYGPLVFRNSALDVYRLSDQPTSASVPPR
jgi:hypothetical protein